MDDHETVTVWFVSSPDCPPLAKRGNDLATIEAFLVEWAEHYQDLGNDQSGRSISQFHTICHVTITILMVYTESVI